ncbi:NHL repeat-containing protein [Hymenobacter sp. CRA2]|uniref:NHL repeat-containing protein n=1 Tax=Hymenobacter sp. CRA2 TaxID=1955620 RepID=UPI001C375E4B|nr:NHL repeat-containing protein [Hymenobacter sp. CRA2]
MGIALAADGTLYVADTDNHTIRRVTPAGVVTTLAGAAGAKGSNDGQGGAARFNHPVGIAVAADGMLYITDADNHTIRKVTPAGEVTTLAGQVGRKGGADGAGRTAAFYTPHGIAVGSDGTVYVSDTENHTLRRISAAGEVGTLAGAAGQKGSTDGSGSAARFFHPAGLALDATGTLYVADNGNHTVRKVLPAGTVTTLAGQPGRSGSADGPASAARFDWPNGVSVDAQGVVYVTDCANATVRRISPAGEVSTLAGRVHGWGYQDGAGPDARFEVPLGIAVEASGATVFVTDAKNQLIRCIR